jgi:hypothetical protein
MALQNAFSNLGGGRPGTQRPNPGKPNPGKIKNLNDIAGKFGVDAKPPQAPAQQSRDATFRSAERSLGGPRPGVTQPKDVNDLQTAKNRKSIFAANVSLEDHKKRDARMAELQMREIIEEKRAAIQHIEIKAWHCRECEEYFEKKDRMELCVERNHTVVLKEKVKKVRVQCVNCKNIAYGVGSSYPDACEKCGDRMVKVSFYRTASSSDDALGRPEMRLRETDAELDDGPSTGQIYAPLAKSVGEQMLEAGD